jgi:fermentation-respiration switch protein FrsA (DUF1100 family)
MPIVDASAVAHWSRRDIVLALRRIAGAIAVGVAIYLLMIAAFENRLIFYPTRELAATPADFGLEFEDVTLTTEDGIELHGWWIPAERERAVLLFFHGNAGNIGDRLVSIDIFHRLGLSVFILDYRGYGRSEGTPSENGTYVDGAAAWKYLTAARSVDPERIVVFGRSLGAAVAAKVAADHPPLGLILESAFTSVPDMATVAFPLLPVRFLTRTRYDNLKRIAEIRCPVMIVHSRDDEIIPFAHAERLFAAANEPKRLLEIRYGHNDGFVLSGALYLDGVTAFLDAHVGA